MDNQTAVARCLRFMTTPQTKVKTYISQFPIATYDDHDRMPPAYHLRSPSKRSSYVAAFSHDTPKNAIACGKEAVGCKYRPCATVFLVSHLRSHWTIAFAELAIPLYAPRTMKHKLWITLITCLVDGIDISDHTHSDTGSWRRSMLRSEIRLLARF